MGQLDALEAQVTRVTSLKESIKTYIKGLSDQIEANKLDPVKIQALADELDTDVNDITTAITANTPAATS